MAATRAFKSYLKTELHFSTDPRVDAIIAEGLDSFEVFLDFDDKSIQTLCSNVHKPGGTHVVGCTTVPNNGISVPSRLKLDWK